MKYCQHCGGEIHDEAVICIHCGRAIQNSPATNKSNVSTLITIAKVFMIISCVAAPAVGLIYGFILIAIAAAAATTEALIAAIILMIGCCLPLAWTLPLTISVNRKSKSHEPIGIAVKICTLLFVNTIAGILLLCANDESN